MDDDDCSKDEDLYQYYTLVSETNETSNEGESILYVAYKEGDDDEEDEQQIESTHPMLQNIKVITLNDGRVFMTTSELEDASLEQQQETLDNNENDEAKNILQEIELSDGTTAVIDIDLLQQSLSASSKPTKPEVEKKFPCLYSNCDKEYTTAHHLRVHMRSHSGYRPYQCSVIGCDKAFSTSYSLKSHIRIHTGEKPYGCNLCPKHFKTSGDLQKHIRTHTGEKPFKCPIEGCNRSFTTSNIRKVHIRSHTGERPYVCEYPNCGKGFASATNYKNHMRIHSGEKPYVCPVEGCGKRFTEYSSLYKHNVVHQPFKPYVCNYCGQQCKQESTLKAHKRTIHNVIITEHGTEILVTQQNEPMPDIILEVSDRDENISDFVFVEDETNQ